MNKSLTYNQVKFIYHFKKYGGSLSYGINEFPVLITIPPVLKINIEGIEALKRIDKYTFDNIEILYRKLWVEAFQEKIMCNG